MLPDLPGWDSLLAVTRYHSWAEIAGIVFVGLLVVAEVVTYQYGHRKDDLTEQQQTATKKRHDEEMTRVQHDTALANEKAAELGKEAEMARASIAEANARAAEANQHAQETTLEFAKFKPPRSLTSDQQAAIAEQAKPFAGTPFVVYTQPESEPLNLADQISNALIAAGWNLQTASTGVTLNRPGKPGFGMTTLTGVRVQNGYVQAARMGNSSARCRETHSMMPVSPA
jgi:hypothetical protein